MIQQNISAYCCGILDVGSYSTGSPTYRPLEPDNVKQFTAECKNATGFRSEGLVTYSTIDPTEKLHEELRANGWVLAAKFKSRMGNYPVWYYTLIVRPYKESV